MKQVGHLNELQKKYFDKGLRVIAITAEPMGTVESKMRNPAPEFWIGSDPGRATSAQFLSGKGGGIPHAYLVDATGKVVSDAHPANMRDSQIEELLSGAFDGSLGRELHKSLGGAVKLYGKGQYGKAWAAAGKFAENESREISSDAIYLRKRAEACAAFRKKLVETGIEGKDYATVYEDIAEISKAYAGMEIAAWVAETKKTLDGDAAVATEVKAWKALTKARAKEKKAGGKEKKLGAARTAYKRLAKKYEGTRAGKLAEEALRRLGG